MTVRNTIPVGADPSGIAIGAGSVWVTNGGSSTVSRISPETEQVVGDPIDVPGGPAGIAVGRGGVWVANSFAASVSRIDPKSGTVQATIAVGDRPVDVAIDEDGLWVADAGSGNCLARRPGHQRRANGGCGQRPARDRRWARGDMGGQIPGRNHQADRPGHRRRRPDDRCRRRPERAGRGIRGRPCFR